MALLVRPVGDSLTKVLVTYLAYFVISSEKDVSQPEVTWITVHQDNKMVCKILRYFKDNALYLHYYIIQSKPNTISKIKKHKETLKLEWKRIKK